MASIINAISSGAGGVAVTGDSSGVLNIQTSNTTAISVDASQNVTFTNGANLPNTFGFKNRIINGAMMIDQRNAGASVTPTANSYTLDRWKTDASQASKFTVQQNAGSVTPPAGFKYYYGVTSSSSYSVGTSESFGVYQNIEGYNVADLGFGAAGASTITISFWVRSSLTGTFGGALNNSAFNRSYPFSYTISAANTWEQKFVTVTGDTSGTWLTTNGIGLVCYFSLGTGATSSGTAGSWAGASYQSATGATSVVGTSGATFYITGVQLEKGSTATSFDYRPYGTEMGLCQRYYTKSYNDGVTPGTITDTGALSTTCQATTSYLAISPVSLSVEMRVTPTIVIFNPVTGSSTASVSIRNVNANTNHAGYVPVSGSKYINLSTDNSSITAGNRITAHFTASAEL